MKYEIIIDNKILKQFRKLPPSISKRITQKLRETENNPYHYFKKLENRDEYKLRVGEYRIIASIDNGKVRVLILHIWHRKNVYKKL